MKIEYKDYCKDKLIEAAKEMALSARTAPKGRGRDQLHILILTDNDKDALADQMISIGEEKGIEFFVRDGRNLKSAPVVLLLGTETSPLEVPDCGFCGFADCQENRERETAPCAFSTGDLGIAMGAAGSDVGERVGLTRA